MNSFPVERIRNVGLFSHGSAGKTSLTEALLFLSHAINRQGRVEDGSTTSDWDADEIKRQISISTSVAPLESAHAVGPGLVTRTIPPGNVSITAMGRLEALAPAQPERSARLRGRIARPGMLIACPPV